MWYIFLCISWVPILFYLWWVQHLLKLYKSPSYYLRVVGNFFFCCYVFENDSASEHNAILSQFRTTYQKSCKQWNLKACWNQFWPKSDMPNDVYATLLNLKLFCYSITLFLLQSLKKDFEVMKNIKILNWSFKETGTIYR